jgi:hypothetical protein
MVVEVGARVSAKPKADIHEHDHRSLLHRRWPRAAVAAVALLLVALALTISLAVTLGGHTTTRTVVKPTLSQPALNQPEPCRIGHPC